LVFESRRVGRFFELLRRSHRGDVVCEPRHESWALPAADRLLCRFRIARVAADPPRVAGFAVPGGWPGIGYYRWHGSPRPYFSPYAAAALHALAAQIASLSRPVWIIFDNTGSGAAAANALELNELL
jgi:uncharacterized protein YecE (DUF72 family)